MSIKSGTVRATVAVLIGAMILTLMAARLSRCALTHPPKTHHTSAPPSQSHKTYDHK